MTRAWMEINLQEVINNYETVKALVSNKTSIMPIVKSNSYGLGMEEVALELNKNEVECFGVLTADEAFKLREKGINKPILILSYIPINLYEKVIDNGCSAVAYNFESLKAILKALKNKPFYGSYAPLHIKFNTGMNRLGFTTDIKTVEQIACMLKEHNLTNIEGLMSQLSTSDEEDTTFSEKQSTRLKKAYHYLNSTHQVNFKYVHIQNSAAIQNSKVFEKDNLYNMVRPGAMLFGIHTLYNKRVSLKSTFSLKSRIICINDIGSYQPVGYNQSFVTKRQSKIAIVSIGFADCSFGSGSNINFLINGERAPVIGGVCMDHCFVDVSDLSNVKVNDEVVIIGKSASDEINLDEFSNSTGISNLEFPGTITNRVTRIYYKGGEIDGD